MNEQGGEAGKSVPEKWTNGAIIIAKKTTGAAAPLLLHLLHVEAMTTANATEGASAQDATAEEMRSIVSVNDILRLRQALKILVAVLPLHAAIENDSNDQIILLKHFARAL